MNDKARKVLDENERLKQEVEDLNFYIDSYRQTWEVDKYRQALQEIREYCKEQNLKTDYTACEILDKINEVMGEK